MCGILGNVGYDFDQNESALKLLYRRGPDSFGQSNFLVKDKKITLAMTRLAITGLDTGSQPMYSNDEKIILTYNGEIYNYKKLWDELKINRSPRSDGEIIIELYQKFGIKGLKKIRGMFAISLIDLNINKLFLLRDYFGEKPLYVYRKNSKFIWSSRIDSILCFENELSIKNSVLQDYFRFSYVPTEESIYEGIESLKPGLCYIYDLTEEKYSTIDFRKDYYDTSQKESFYRLLQSKTKQALIGEVPMGILLSGGVDSGLLACLQSKKEIKAFTVSTSDLHYDEAKRALKLAKHLSLQHFVISFHNEFNSDDFFSFLKSLDQPFADSSVVLSWTAFNYIKKNHPEIKVILTGDGGDEIWGGYNKHKILNLPSQKYFKYLFKIVAKLVLKINDHFFINIISNNIYRLAKAYSWNSRYMGVLSLGFDKWSLNKLFEYNYKDQKNSEANNLEEAIKLDHKYSLCYDLNVKTDSAAMYNSIESRSPFLDLDLFEKNRLKFKNKREVSTYFKELFPRNYLNSKKKGFSFNVRDFLINDFSFYSKKYLSSKMLKNIPGIKIDYAKAMIETFFDRPTNRDTEIFSLLVASIWINSRN